MNPHRQNAKKHAKRRLAERFGIKLKASEYNEILGRIRNNKAKFLHKQQNGRTLWLIHLQKKWFVVVFDKYLKTIVTAFNYTGYKDYCIEK